MTTDDIIRLAREADFKAGGGEFWVEQPDGICTPELERLVKLAYEAGATAERNACLAEFVFGRNTAEIKSAIRARSKE